MASLQDSLYDFKKMLDQQYLPQILCLIAQIFLTIVTSIKVYQNKQSFPIKQLGLLTTLVAIMSFQLVNIVNIIAKVIQTSNGLFDKNKQAQFLSQCGQCRLYNHPYMITLAIIYNFLREMQLLIFSLKILRVGLCYWKRFYKKKQIPNWFIKLFSSDVNMLIIVLIHTSIVIIINSIIFLNSFTQFNAFQLFGFFCPKISSIFQYFIYAEKFTIFLIAYSMSINTYKEMDFKKFLLIFYLISNTQIALRAYINILQIGSQTYHEFYYHSFITALFGTFTMAYFSKFKQVVNASPGRSIIDSWSTFRNVPTGIQILKLFSRFIDQNLLVDYHQKALHGLLYVDEHMKIAIDQGKNVKYQQQRAQISEILQVGNELKIPGQVIQEIKNKNNAGAISINELRALQNYLSKFCQNQIYKKWKSTYSYRYYAQQCQNNMLINDKLQLFNIPIG